MPMPVYIIHKHLTLIKKLLLAHLVYFVYFTVQSTGWEPTNSEENPEATSSEG